MIKKYFNVIKTIATKKVIAIGLTSIVTVGAVGGAAAYNHYKNKATISNKKVVASEKIENPQVANIETSEQNNKETPQYTNAPSTSTPSGTNDVNSQQSTPSINAKASSSISVTNKVNSSSSKIENKSSDKSSSLSSEHKKTDNNSSNSSLEHKSSSSSSSSENKISPKEEKKLPNGKNVALTNALNEEFKNRYTGIKFAYFESLLADMAKGIKSQSEVKSIINGMTWKENSTTDYEVERVLTSTCVTKANDANRVPIGLVDGKYYRAYVYTKNGENHVALLGIKMYTLTDE